MTLNPSYCRFMAEKMKVQDKNVEHWWMGAKKAVNKKLKTNGKNVIMAIKIDFKVSPIDGWLAVVPLSSL